MNKSLLTMQVLLYLNNIAEHPGESKYRYTLGKVDVKLPGKWNSNSHGARPVHQIISMI